MPLRRFTAVQFRRPMERGLNRPFLALGKPQDGPRVPLVVKPRAGYADRPEAMLRELFSLLLARDLGLTAPEPVLVVLLEGFDHAAVDHEGYPELIRDSLGWNVGTVHLGENWKPWIQGSPPRSIPTVAMESAYAFDGMVQNSDREADNPNLLWRGGDLAVLDFDKAFGYLRSTEAEAAPWRTALPRQNLARHCLHPHLPELVEGRILGTDLWDRFEEWRLESPSGRITAEIGTVIADPDLDLPRMDAYLTKLAAATDDFFRYLTEVSRP